MYKNPSIYVVAMSFCHLPVVVVAGCTIFFASRLVVKLLTQSLALTIAYNKVMC